MPDLIQVIKEEIKEGKENAVSNYDLQQVTHATRREVSAAVHKLRAEGMIICSCQQGYFIPKDDTELLQGYSLLWKMAVSGLSALKPMRAEIVKRGLLSMTAEGRSRRES